MIIQTVVFLCIAAILAFNDSVFERLRLPKAALTLLLGIIIGPAVLTLVHLNKVEQLLSEGAVIIILLAAGYSLNWDRFMAAIKPGLLVGLMGVLLSLVLGFSASYLFRHNFEEAIYVGIALSATSIGLSVSLLNYAGSLQSKVGQILLAAAVVDDIFVLFILATAHAGFSSGTDSNGVLLSFLMSLLMLFALTVLLSIIARLINSYSLKLIKFPRRASIVLIAFISAGLTEKFGLSLVIGGFITGAIFSLFKSSPTDSDTVFFNNLSKIAAPLFLLAVGIQLTDMTIGTIDMLWYVSLILIASILGKIMSPLIIAPLLSPKEGCLLGFAMLPRAEVAIIVASVGMKQQHLSHHATVALVMMTVVTVILASIVVPKLASVISAPKPKMDSTRE
ncbi:MULTISPECIES: cation:proton antiporter [Methylophaga]|uniref:Na+/H+ antiporter NapA-like protein n=1 Tax=Methylophaga aminisulfidivorans MP TaxID=1026882 RepID=F5T121_9GAMM|nr:MULTISPECIES: cation:proton antiporter [Methylophaga]EGL53917.1 Na+/H+ antiporter NapA-like protein [Methylophaga aminisulfidivorans MP]WVI83682.1 cation:proton antiporter [Methylophaga thalassica]